MSSSQTFQNQGLITGTTDYYQLLFLDNVAREKALHLIEVIQRMEQLVSHSNETQLHLTRVNWWQQQIQLMVDGKATLPAMVQLQTAVSSKKLNYQLLEQSLQAISDEFFHTSFIDNEQQKSWCQRRFGMANMALAQLLGADTESIGKFIQYSAEVEGYCYLLKRSSQFLSRGIIPFSAELISELSLSEGELLEKDNLKSREQVAKKLSTMAEQSWVMALSELANDQALKLLPVLVRCNIHISWLKKIAKSDFLKQHGQQNDILPIKKFWLAWRWHKKATKLSKRKS